MTRGPTQKCETPGCTVQVSPRRLFCPACTRAVTPDQWWALRLASTCPMHRCSAKQCWGWPYIDGSEHCWVMLPTGDGQNVKGAAKVSDLLAWLEWNMLVVSVAAEVDRARWPMWDVPA